MCFLPIFTLLTATVLMDNELSCSILNTTLRLDTPVQKKLQSYNNTYCSQVSFRCLEVKVCNVVCCISNHHEAMSLQCYQKLQILYFTTLYILCLAAKKHRLRVPTIILAVKFKDFSRTFKDPEVAFSRNNSRQKFTAWTVLEQHLIYISVITVQLFWFPLMVY